MKVGVVPFALGATYSDLEASWRAAEDAGFDALWTIDHATPTRDLQPAWEASSLLLAMAARTKDIPVGVLVFDVMLRHPRILAGSIAVAQELSGGRVRVGLGAGDKFSKLDHDALGIGFPSLAERIGILELACQALQGLAELIIGGASRALMEAAVTYASGWNLFTQQPEVFATRVKELQTIEAQHHRHPLRRSVYLFADRVAGDVGRTLKDFEAMGADEVMLVVMKPTADAILELGRSVVPSGRRHNS